MLQRELTDLDQVGGPGPHEEPELEGYRHEMLPKAGEDLSVQEPLMDGVELDARKVSCARADEFAYV